MCKTKCPICSSLLKVFLRVCFLSVRLYMISTQNFHNYKTPALVCTYLEWKQAVSNTYIHVRMYIHRSNKYLSPSLFYSCFRLWTVWVCVLFKVLSESVLQFNGFVSVNVMYQCVYALSLSSHAYGSIVTSTCIC